MSNRRFSQYSLVSAPGEELDNFHAQYTYELNNHPPRHVPDTYPKKGFVVSEEQILLNQAEHEFER